MAINRRRSHLLIAAAALLNGQKNFLWLYYFHEALDIRMGIVLFALVSINIDKVLPMNYYYHYSQSRLVCLSRSTYFMGRHRVTLKFQSLSPTWFDRENHSLISYPRAQTFPYQLNGKIWFGMSHDLVQTAKFNLGCWKWIQVTPVGDGAFCAVNGFIDRANIKHLGIFCWEIWTYILWDRFNGYIG